ncbi:hypothetical protein [Paradevosia shaoguanensis]|uniref:hypothetical protein n=1 Tax=Paradevosia shaoguanensis TaxID=1335043 RepID=UPI0019344C60|nr:hypothetical protein [Paradevosia shaoguanensis]
MARKPLELDEHPAFQERFWTLERWFWAGFALVVLAGLLGLLGGGGLFSRSTARAGTSALDYPTVARWQSDVTLELDLAPGVTTITLLPSLTDVFDIEHILPQPDEENLGPDGIVLVFGTASGGHVTMAVRANRPGPARWGIRLGPDELSISTLVMP